MKYETIRLTGGYRDRQLAANKAGAICYVEHHLNALEYDAPGSKDNPALVVVCKNASARSVEWGTTYCDLVARAFDVPDVGVVRRGPEGRGYWNLFYTKMPAILIEPLYISDPEHAALALSAPGQERLADVLCQSIERQFPKGGRIALSCGHGAVQGDRGAPARDAARKIIGWESEICSKVLAIVESRYARS